MRTNRPNIVGLIGTEEEKKNNRNDKTRLNETKSRQKADESSKKVSLEGGDVKNRETS